MMLSAQLALIFLAKQACDTLVDAASAYSYDPFSDVGPDVWNAILMENNQCGGTSNSPIALESNACTLFADYAFDSGTCTLKDYGFAIKDNGHQASLPSNGTCTPATMQIPGIEGVFELLQFHIHTNSEHTMDDERYAAELHMVHKLQGGDRLAVMGVFIRANSFENNARFSNVLAEFDRAADETAIKCNLTAPNHWWSDENRTALDSTDSVFQIYDLVPEGSTYYNYDGGLTTPPCSEIVEWNVADIPLSISIAQYNDLSSLILNYIAEDTCEQKTIASPSGSTSRPLQDLNGRNVTHICPVGYDDPLAKESATATSSASLMKSSMAVTPFLAALILVA